MRWCKNESEESPSIKPGAEAEFTIEVIGRTRLTDATIQIDYANLGKRRSEVEEHFFTRQVSAPISITVNASVQLQRPDIVPLSGNIGWSDTVSSGSQAQSDHESSITPASGKADGHLRSFINQKQSHKKDEEHCMLLLDLRNSWPNPLSITLQARKPMLDGNYSDESWNEAHGVNEIIQPGHVSRIVMILPKVYLQDPHAAVPSLNPANQRQFVVSTSKISPETERASREAFWYREELLKIVRGTWTEDGNGRHGELELRGIRFTPRMVEAIKLEDLAITTTIIADYPTSDGENAVRKIGRAKFNVPIDEM